jgi:hypothetical protein
MWSGFGKSRDKAASLCKTMMAKVRLYRELMGEYVGSTIMRRARKRLGLRGFGVIIQECVDLVR